MQQIPLGNFGPPQNNDNEDHKNRAEAKAKRRKARQRQRLILLGGFALIVILVIVVIVIIFRSIFGGKGKDTSSSVPASSLPVSEAAPLPPHRFAVDPGVWNLVLVNTQKQLDPSYEMPAEQLATVTPVGHVFDARAADSLKQMLADCNANVEGGSLTIYSGYRGPSRQNQNHQRMVEIYMGQGMSEAEAILTANRIEPPSGQSEHQTGLAVDFTTNVVNEPQQAFEQTPEFQWLQDNAANYGFILRYTREKEDITGFLYQPYHWRYVGPEDAAIIKADGICLEEYLMALPASAVPVDSLPPEEPAEDDASSPPA